MAKSRKAARKSTKPIKDLAAPHKKAAGVKGGGALENFVTQIKVTAEAAAQAAQAAVSPSEFATGRCGGEKHQSLDRRRPGGGPACMAQHRRRYVRHAA